MNGYSLGHLSDSAVLRGLASLVAQDCVTTAAMLAHLAEVDARKLYLPAAYPSMFAYCVGELRVSEDAAFRRLRAARTARAFPMIFPAVAGGRLSLSAVLVLAPYLTRESAAGLVAAAEHKSKAGLEQLLAERFPQPDLEACVRALAPSSAPAHITPSPVAPSTACGTAAIIPDQGQPNVGSAARNQLAPAPVGTPLSPDASPRMGPLPARCVLTPIAPQRFALQVTLSQETHDKLRYAQALLGHAVPSGDIAQVLERALDALIGRLEKRRFAACAQSRPRTGLRRGGSNPRSIPARVRREVWQRDQGRCTFVSDRGRRCEAVRFLEFDHVTPVARGGESNLAGLRLRCRAHNQHAAERVFGRGFMDEKRRLARRRKEAARCRSSSAPALGGFRGRPLGP